MAKDPKNNEESSKVSFANNTEDDMRFLNNVRSYVIEGNDMKEDVRWAGTVKINKEVTLSFTHSDRRLRYQKYPPSKKLVVSISELSKMMLIAVQEGPEDMRKDIWAFNGKPRDKSIIPLQIELVDHLHNPEHRRRLEQAISPRKAPVYQE